MERIKWKELKERLFSFLFNLLIFAKVPVRPVSRSKNKNNQIEKWKLIIQKNQVFVFT